MAKYRATATSFVNNRIVQAGDVLDLDGEVSPANFEPADKAAKAAEVKSAKAAEVKSLPPEVDQFITAVKLHAASRGVPPTEVNETDFEDVAKEITPPPTPQTLMAGADKLGGKFGQSVA